MSDIDEFLAIVGTESPLHYHFYTNSSGRILEILLDDNKTRRWPVVWKTRIKETTNDPDKQREIWWKNLDELDKIRAMCNSGKAKKTVHKCDWL